jgi:neutral ceramidase
MARSHIAVALSAALVTLVIVGQLVINLGLPQVDFWHWRLDQDQHYHTQTHFLNGKQADGAVEDASQYLIGVGKADITGYVNLYTRSDCTDMVSGLSLRST